MEGSLPLSTTTVCRVAGVGEDRTGTAKPVWPVWPWLDQLFGHQRVLTAEGVTCTRHIITAEGVISTRHITTAEGVISTCHITTAEGVISTRHIIQKLCDRLWYAWTNQKLLPAVPRGQPGRGWKCVWLEKVGRRVQAIGWHYLLGGLAVSTIIQLSSSSTHWPRG